MVVKADRAPAQKPIGSKVGSAARIAATPVAAVGNTVARIPPGPVAEEEGRGALAEGSGTTLSLPVWPACGGASPTRGDGVGGDGGVNGSRAGGRSLPVRLPSTDRSRRIRNTATSPMRIMS